MELDTVNLQDQVDKFRTQVNNLLEFMEEYSENWLQTTLNERIDQLSRMRTLFEEIRLLARQIETQCGRRSSDDKNAEDHSSISLFGRMFDADPNAPQSRIYPNAPARFFLYTFLLRDSLPENVDWPLTKSFLELLQRNRI